MVKEKARSLKSVIAGINDFKKKIGVEKAVLFGSYARGEAGRHSDVDLILLSKKFEAKTFLERLKGLWIKWPLDLPVDFICYTPEEFESEKKRISIASHALKEGIVI